jgi:arginyl-tRNA--protein-N-Asp/Glu arginylyltransferase
MAGIGHVALNIIETKTHRSGRLLVVTLVDLHYTGIGSVYASLKDGSVS